MERRWDLEEKGFTKEGFFQILEARLLRHVPPGRFIELGVGDGLVGSLGAWLERAAVGWKVEGWENRVEPARQYRKNRPEAQLFPGRLTAWTAGDFFPPPVGITTRGCREASGVCRAIRQGLMRPAFLGIWNPSRRPQWARRLQREKYQLQCVWQNVEFYYRSA